MATESNAKPFYSTGEEPKPTDNIVTSYSRSQSSKFDVYIEITVEKKLNILAGTKEDAEQLAINRIKNHSKFLVNSKLKPLTYEVVDIEELPFSKRPYTKRCTD